MSEEKLYIRFEDTILEADNRVEVLTGLTPLDLDDVKSTMREKNIHFSELNLEWELYYFRRPGENEQSTFRRTQTPDLGYRSVADFIADALTNSRVL